MNEACCSLHTGISVGVQRRIRKEDGRIMDDLNFYEKMRIVCLAIPAGKVASYGQIALLCGRPGNSRQVGYGLRENLAGSDIPAYRVVNGKGELSGACHFEMPGMQKMLLEEDGIEVKWNGKCWCVDLKKYGWKNSLNEAEWFRMKFLLYRFTQMSRKLFGDNLTGVYLHGSAALGCFNPEKSDLDLILVTENEISEEDKMEFMKETVRLNAEAPPKGMELSIVKRECCSPFMYPTPFELHFSAAHLNWFRENPEDYIEKMQGTDKDLAAHFTIINHYGIVLYGAEIQDVFDTVPKENYIDSIWYDVEHACEDILENPMYIILNLCRVLAYVQEDLILSKKSGGEWGIRKLPQEFRKLVGEALTCYETNCEMIADDKTAKKFAETMIEKIKNIIG